MKPKEHLLSLSLLAASALLAAVPAAYGQDDNNLGPYKQIATISNIPSGLAGGFDISWVDSASGRYYLADRGNPKATPSVDPGIDVLDTRHPEFLNEITLPTSLGTNGVILIRRSADDNGEDQTATLVVGGNDSHTYFVNLTSDLAHAAGTPISVDTGGKVRADELAYDPKDQIILITNPDELTATPPSPPFLTFISAKTHAVLGKIVYDGKPGPGHGKLASGGIEQPVWDAARGRFYINIPSTVPSTSTAPNDDEVDVIDPVKMTIKSTIATPCPKGTAALGLALIPGQRLMNGCGEVIDIQSRKVIHQVTLPPISPTVPAPPIFADEIWYNPGDERVYFGSFVNTPVVSGLPPYNFVANLPWSGAFPTKFTHSVAADRVVNNSFVPVSNTGVLVFTDETGRSDN